MESDPRAAWRQYVMFWNGHIDWKMSPGPHVMYEWLLNDWNYNVEWTDTDPAEKSPCMRPLQGQMLWLSYTSFCEILNPIIQSPIEPKYQLALPTFIFFFFSISACWKWDIFLGESHQHNNPVRCKLTVRRVTFQKRKMIFKKWLKIKCDTLLITKLSSPCSQRFPSLQFEIPQRATKQLVAWSHVAICDDSVSNTD